MKLTWQDFEDAAIALGCDISAVRAVCQVEAPNGGFNPDGSVSTLFEGHKFYKYTDGRFAIDAPDLCFRNWTKVHYGKTWQQEQDRLNRAKALDHDAALMSASWGKFQIMGFNYEAAGFTNVRDFVDAMHKGEREHLMAFVGFVRKNGLAIYLRGRDWASFARGYNGASYAENQYDKKIAAAYAKFAGAPEPIKAKAVPKPTTQPTGGIFALIAKILQAIFSKKKE